MHTGKYVSHVYNNWKVLVVVLCIYITTHHSTKKYCHLKQEIQQLSDVIRYQKAISNSHVIPRQYKPKPVFISQPNNGKLQQSFDVQYEKIFFEHLSRVIKENEIDIGIKQARLDSLIRTVEKTPTVNSVIVLHNKEINI